jgi:signal transduction histidine kinase
MISIRRRMTLLVCGGIALFLLGGGFALYWTIRAVLTAQFDATLAAKAQALIVAADLDDEDLEIDLNVQEFAGFGSRAGGDFFEVRGADGRTLEKSPSLGADNLISRAVQPFPTYGPIKLPDGRSGRAIWKSFESSAGGPAQSENLSVIVASYGGGLERSLHAIILILVGVGLAGLILIVVLVHTCLRLGLQPLEDLGRRLRSIRSTHLHERLPTVQLPRELQPITEKLNEMLERLEAGFDRERRFSSYAAHELRTPLTELKVMTELVTNWPQEFNRRHGEEMLEAIAENEALLDKLSLLSSAENERVSVESASVDLIDGVRDCVARVSESAKKRGLTIDTEVERKAILTDPLLWTAILNNLLGNAVSYAPRGAHVLVEASLDCLAVSNDAPELEADDIPHLFERFWRKSEARSEKGHSGLGLAVVAACTERLGATSRATLQNHLLRIEIRWSA